jgi:predicted aldo/keto reductase-like oxidoreductase
MRKLGFGLMRLPLQNPEDPKSIDLEQLMKMTDDFLAEGFTYFDTAYMYHEFQSEIAIREALVKRHPRDHFTLTTKLPTMFLKTEEDMERIFQEQMEKCGVEFFDYYLLHNLGVSHYAIAQKLDCFGFIQKKKAEAKSERSDFPITTMQSF